jgi:hypothetical protein
VGPALALALAHAAKYLPGRIETGIAVALVSGAGRPKFKSKLFCDRIFHEKANFPR